MTLPKLEMRNVRTTIFGKLYNTIAIEDACLTEFFQ